MVDKLVDKIFRRRRGKFQIETQDEQMRHTEIADERDLMLRRRQQMRRILGTQHFRRMRIERHDDRSSVFGLRVAGRRGNNGLMAPMDAIENANGEEEWTGQTS